MEKYIEDARQDEKHVPDLLEAIIRSPGLEKRRDTEDFDENRSV